MTFSRFVSLSWCCLAIALLMPGCSHYRLGTGAAPKFQTLYVAPVANRTLLPQARELVTTRIRETFARDGRVTLTNSADTADATLSIAIVDYHRDVSAVREGDTGLARKFDLILTAACTLRDRNGMIIFENRPVTVRREAFTDLGQLQSEYQTLPLLAESLSDRVLHLALDIW
jgi:hypothetical protein